MGMRISGKNIDTGESFRTMAEKRIGDAVAKYFDGGYDGHVTVARDGTGFLTECAVHLDTGVVMSAEGRAQEVHRSFDVAAEHIEKQLRRYKRKRKEHHERQARGETGSEKERA
jgi:ribosomal subunit interface protein